MLLESVYSRSFCWNRASYLVGGQGGFEGIMVAHVAPRRGHLGLAGPLTAPPLPSYIYHFLIESSSSTSELF